MKLLIVCKQHTRGAAGGEPKLVQNGGYWEVDLSDMYCTREPSHHPDAPIEFEIVAVQ
jgi:hypothetical protein